MTRGQKRSLMRRLHAGVGSGAALLIIIVAVTGIWLQHPAWLGESDNKPLSLVVDPTDGTRFLRGTHWGVEVSEGGAEHWQEVPMLAPPTDVSRIFFVAGAPGDGVVYAMGKASMVMSSDGGRIWYEVPGPSDDSILQAKFLDLSISSTGELILLTSIGLYQKEVSGPWRAVGKRMANEGTLGQMVHNIHTGHVFGRLGRTVAEGGAWALVVLTITGLVLHRRVGHRNKGKRT